MTVKSDLRLVLFDLGGVLLRLDNQAFANVVEQYDCAPEKIHFFDDNPLNISAANEFGMHAVLCQTGADLAGALIDREIVQA